MQTNPIDDLFFSVNDIYTQYDEGDINYIEALEILRRVATHFLESTKWKQILKFTLAKFMFITKNQAGFGTHGLQTRFALVATQ